MCYPVTKPIGKWKRTEGERELQQAFILSLAHDAYLWRKTVQDGVTSGLVRPGVILIISNVTRRPPRPHYPTELRCKATPHGCTNASLAHLNEY